MAQIAEQLVLVVFFLPELVKLAIHYPVIA